MIRKAIETATGGLLVGRFGTIEFDVLWEHANGHAIPRDMLHILERNAGVFGTDIRQWCVEYMEAVKGADFMATGWYEPIKVREQRLLTEFTGKQVALRSLEPYYWNESTRWSSVLKGKVCVVSSFADTIMKQVCKERASGIWSKVDGKMWGDIEWSAVRTGYAPSLALGRASWSCDPSSWKDCVDYVVEEVLQTGGENCYYWLWRIGDDHWRTAESSG